MAASPAPRLMSTRRLPSSSSRRRYRHLQRIWNYLDDINQGEGDEERYRVFCSGRAKG